MEVPPGEVCVVQCGIRFSVALPGGCARGYVLEVFGSHFILPDLGPVGELAHPEPQGLGYSLPDIGQAFCLLEVWPGTMMGGISQVAVTV